MKKLFTLALVSAFALVSTTWAEQKDPHKKAAKQNKPAQQAKPVVQKHPAKTHAQGAHLQGQNAGQGHNANKFHPNGAVQTNKTVNKVHANTQINKQVNVNANAKVKNLHQANAGKWNQLHQQHQNFHAQMNPHINGAKFNANYHIAGAHNWHGQQYVVFQNYHPQWHDHFWWHNHYHNNVILIGGGWYFWNAGYWFPAWGYSDTEAYYPYDGPIYVGSNPTPPDQIVATVQTSLQEQGFYHGEVDGLLGPQTRAALADYQQAQGLEMTAALDQPTLESLGMS